MKDVDAHYRELFRVHGPSPAAVQWADRETQERRFEVLTQIDASLGSVVDVGCGTGDLLGYLRRKGFEGTYLGLDLVEDFIGYAKEHYREDKNASFNTFNIRTEKIPTGYDYAILCGVFNNLIDDNLLFMKDVISHMFASAGVGVAFNAMSTYVDYKADDLFYSNPCEILDFCKSSVTRKVVLRHDYLVRAGSIPFEYTIYLYR